MYRLHLRIDIIGNGFNLSPGAIEVPIEDKELALNIQRQVFDHVMSIPIIRDAFENPFVRIPKEIEPSV